MPTCLGAEITTSHGQLQSTKPEHSELGRRSYGGQQKVERKGLCSSQSLKQPRVKPALSYSEGATVLVSSFFRKFAPRCSVCKEPIMPAPGQEETVRIVALDRDFHVQCYRCEVSILIT